MGRHSSSREAVAPALSQELPAWPAGTLEEVEAAGLNPDWVRAMVSYVLSEDLGGNPGADVTTAATVSADARHTVQLIARDPGVLAGMPLVPVVLADVAQRLGALVPSIDVRERDGSRVEGGTLLALMNGSTRVLLAAERTMLNLICRASGVATHTRRWVNELEGTGARVLDTRKTTPGLRAVEKYAVRAGGGTNKRMGLYDVAMIKDNHKLAAGSITAAYQAVRTRFPDVPVQVEVTTTEEAVEAVRVGVRFLMCDNMTPDVLARTVKAARDATKEQIEIEATGGLTLETAAEYARTGVDFVSVGGLTHSSPILDIALDIVE